MKRTTRGGLYSLEEVFVLDYRLWIGILARSDGSKLMKDLFLTNMQFFTSQDAI